MEHFDAPDANARLIAASPETLIALIGAVEALRTRELFMQGLGLDTTEMNKIIAVIDELLDRINGEKQET